ncbi:hypothetical protein ILUMI_12694, partial [Ignelater luminosus]
MEPTHLVPNHGLIHFLTGHGPYSTHLQRTNQRKSDRCDCGDEGTPEHRFFECRITRDQTHEMREALRDVPIAEALLNPLLFPVLNKLVAKFELAGQSQREKQLQNNSKKRYNFRKANWDRFLAEFHPPPQIPDRNDVNQQARDITSAIRTAMDRAILLRGDASLVTNKLWSNEFAQLRQRAASAPDIQGHQKQVQTKNLRGQTKQLAAIRRQTFSNRCMGHTIQNRQQEDRVSLNSFLDGKKRWDDNHKLAMLRGIIVARL